MRRLSHSFEIVPGSRVVFTHRVRVRHTIAATTMAGRIVRSGVQALIFLVSAVPG